MSSIDKIKSPIAEEMKKFETFFRSSMKSKVSLLNIITNYIIRRKGKQMRPMFVFLSAKLNGKITESTYYAATMIELLHTATLIHDDIVDDSYERRGFFSINALWKNKISVLVGDYFLSRGLLLAINQKEYDLLHIVSEAVKDMSEGELLQIEGSRKQMLSEDIYFDIIRKKTAALIISCTACGALSVGATSEAVEQMKHFGEFTGMAFQVKDDLLDYQKNGTIGKPTGNDIKEKKATLPLIHVINNASSTDRKWLIDTVRNYNRKSVRVKEVIEFVRKNGGIEYSYQVMNQFRDKALDILKEFPRNDARDSLSELVNYTTQREK